MFRGDRDREDYTETLPRRSLTTRVAETTSIVPIKLRVLFETTGVIIWQPGFYCPRTHAIKILRLHRQLNTQSYPQSAVGSLYKTLKKRVSNPRTVQ